MSVNTIDNNAVSGTMTNVVIPNTSYATNNHSDYLQNNYINNRTTMIPAMSNIVIPSLNASPPAAFAIETAKMNISAPLYVPTVNPIPVVTPVGIPVVTPIATTVGVQGFNSLKPVSAADIASWQLQLEKSQKAALNIQQILAHPVQLPTESLQFFWDEYQKALAQQVYFQNLLLSQWPIPISIYQLQTAQNMESQTVFPQTMTALQGEEEDEIEQSIAQSPRAADELCITGIDTNYGNTSDAAEGGSDGSTISGLSPRVGTMESTIGNTDIPHMTMDDNGESFTSSTQSVQSLETTDTTATDADGELQRDVDRINRMIMADLNRLTLQNVGKLSDRIFAVLVKDPRIVLTNILRKAMNEPQSSQLYAQLCYSMYLDLPTEETQYTFRETLFKKCYSGFKSTHKAAHADHSKSFQSMGMITMIGELHNNYNLLEWKFVDRMLKELLPPQHAVDVEAVCTLLNVAGYTLDHYDYSRQAVDSVMGVLQEHALHYGTRTQFMVQEICALRSNHWQPRNARIEQETPNRNNGYRGPRNGQRNGRRNQHRGQRPRYNNHRGGDSYRSNKYNGQRKQKRLNSNSLKFIEKNGADRTVLPQDMELTKTWTLQNTHSTKWGDDVKLVWLKGDKDILVDILPVPDVLPGQMLDVSVVLRTPILKEKERNRRCAYFKLEKNGQSFGPRFWVDIIVEETKIVGTDGNVSVD